jgi:hypothetical protein
MGKHHVNVLKQADEIRAVLPLTGLHAHEAVHERVTQHGTRAELVGCPEVVRTFLSDPDFADMTEAMAATGQFHVFQRNERPPYFLGVMDDVVQIGVDDDGDPQAIIESTNSDVRDWAEATYERFKREATRVDLADAVASPDGSALD